MNAMAEAQMLVLRPPDVERSRPFENRRVPARGAVEKHDVRTGLDLGAEKIGILGGAPHDHLHRRVIAKHFLDRALRERGVEAQSPPLIRVAHEFRSEEHTSELQSLMRI